MNALLACLLAVVPNPTPGPAGELFAVTAGGVTVPVEAFGDVEVARWIAAEPVEVTVTKRAGPIASARLRPWHLALPVAIAGDRATFRLPGPGSWVLQVDRLRKLFLFVDPPRTVPSPTLRLDPSGAVDETDRLQAAIDALPEGGTLALGPGWYRCGSLRLKSRMTLDLAPGALLQGCADPARFSAFRGGGYLAFLALDGLTDVTLRGGVIDANGYVIRRAKEAANGGRKQAGRALLAVDCRNLTLDGVTLRDAYSWTCHLVDCEDVTIRNLRLLADTRLSNGDGLDLDGCRRVGVEGLFAYAEDDAISLKAAWSRQNVEDIVIRDAVLWSQNATGIRLGTETRCEAFRRILFEDVAILRANTMIRLFAYDRARLELVTFRRFQTEEVTAFADPALDEFRRETELPGGVTFLLQFQVRPNAGQPGGRIRDILVDGFHAAVAAGSKFKGWDLPPGTTAIEGVTLRGLTLAGAPVSDAKTGRLEVGDFATPPRVEP